MSTLSRKDFKTHATGGASTALLVKDPRVVSAGASDALAKADLDRNGAIAGEAELDAAFSTLDAFDPDGNRETLALLDATGAPTKAAHLLDAFREAGRVQPGSNSPVRTRLNQLNNTDVPAAAPVRPVDAAPSSPFARLGAAIHAAAPAVDLAKWLGPLTAAMEANGMVTPRRMAAAIGQFVVEAGSGFQHLEENLSYSSAERIRAVFPSRFPTLEAAQACVRNPQLLANTCYAGKNGNGDVSSGDGWMFRGRGLIQLTGREGYTAFGRSLNLTPEQAAQFCSTPEGAAASACWYWTRRGLNNHADAWDIATVTRRVNGNAMLHQAERLDASNAALQVLTAVGLVPMLIIS